MMKAAEDSGNPGALKALFEARVERLEKKFV